MTEGVACITHPDDGAFARDYGPVCPHSPPFGHGPVRLAAGDVLRLRHRLFAHRGRASPTGIDAERTRYGLAQRATTRLPARCGRFGDAAERRSLCGMRRDLVQYEQDAPADVHVVRVQGSRPHRHAETAELYHVLRGRGGVDLDDETIAVSAGDLVVIRPGVWHTSRPADGHELELLIVALPLQGRPVTPDVEVQ